jgi:C-terminal processing protease CtpA/Prc
LEIVTQDPEALPRKLILERRSLPLPPLKMRMIDAGHGKLVAYIRLHYFSHDATKKMASAIREGESLGVDGYSKAFCMLLKMKMHVLETNY